MDQQREGGSLPRREFLRRSSLGAVALAALGAGVHAPGVRSVLAQVVGDPAADMPEQPIAAVAVWGDDVIAVGGVRGDARAWRRSGPQQPWVQTAGPQSFPHGTALTGLAVQDGRAVASGCSGAEHGTHPALFTSGDVSSWVSEPGVGAAVGVCTGVAFVASQGLAVGARFAEPDVEEPIETIAYRSVPGGGWEPATLPGVRPVRHGSVTLLANAGDRLVVGLTDVQGLALYVAATAEGPWRSIGAPNAGVPVAPVAATTFQGSILLAGIDARDDARFWQQQGRSWLEVDPPTGVGPTVTVRSLRRSGAEVLVAGSRGHVGFVREVKAS